MITKYYIEIKNRLFLIFLTWSSTIFISYVYKETLLFLCLTKVNSFLSSNVIFYFIFTDVKEVFYVYFKLILFIGNQVGVFYLLVHVLAFLSLGLYKFEYRYLKLLFYSGLTFWFFSFFLFNQVLLPVSWNFFLSFQELTSFNLYFEAKLSEYLSFYIFLYYLCTCYCQIFVLLVFFIDYIDMNVDLIKKFRKLFYYFFVIFSTLVTPPDVISQILFSFVIVIAYELMIVCNFLKWMLIHKKF